MDIEPNNETLGNLNLVFGGRSRRGPYHQNEDRQSTHYWRDWDPNGPVSLKIHSNYPIPLQVCPRSKFSQYGNSTICGTGGTGYLSNVNNLLELKITGTLGHSDSGNNAYVWTVCDGHDGPEAAEFVCDHLPDIISRVWHNGSIDSEDPTIQMSRCLTESIEAVDRMFASAVTDPDQNQGKYVGSSSGTCVTSILLQRNRLACAGLGDCKAAILTFEESDAGDSSGPVFNVTWFTNDHRYKTASERNRVREAGGWFRHNRVFGILEPTRTVGDFDVKNEQKPGIVIATPEVRTYEVTKPSILLIASDGIWDVMDATQLLRTLKKRNPLWRSILGWLGASVPGDSMLSKLRFRRRAKSKEGVSSLLRMPTEGDMVGLAEWIATRAHDLGSDDDCTCIAVYLRPADDLRVDGANATEELDALPIGLAIPQDRTMDACETHELDDSEDDEELLDVDIFDFVNDEVIAQLRAKNDQGGPTSLSDYEKWHSDDGCHDDAGNNSDSSEQEPSQGRSTFPVRFNTRMIEPEFPDIVCAEPPELAEKTKIRRQKRIEAIMQRRLNLEHS